MKNLLAASLFFFMAITTLAGCNETLVSETCALCGAKATKNYISRQKTEFTISIKDGKSAKFIPGEPVALCDRDFTAVEFGGGPSK